MLLGLLALLLAAASLAASASASSSSAGPAAERACSAGGGAAELPFCDPSLPLDDRVEDLVGRLTVDEKVGGWLCACVVESKRTPNPRGPTTPSQTRSRSS